jgi:hypothetical protein
MKELPMRSRNHLHAAVVAELARRGLHQRDLAALLGVPDTTLSDWLRRIHPAPTHLVERIEASLGLQSGSLNPTT